MPGNQKAELKRKQHPTADNGQARLTTPKTDGSNDGKLKRKAARAERASARQEKTKDKEEGAEVNSRLEEVSLAGTHTILVARLAACAPRAMSSSPLA